MKYANGDVYVGMYKDGKKHFQGEEADSAPKQFNSLKSAIIVR